MLTSLSVDEMLLLRYMNRSTNFILLDRSDWDLIDNLSIAFHNFTRCMLTSLSVDEILLLRYMNWPTNFKELLLSGDGSFLCKTYVLFHLHSQRSQCLQQLAQTGVFVRSAGSSLWSASVIDPVRYCLLYFLM